MPVPRWLKFRKPNPAQDKRISLGEGEKLHVIHLCPEGALRSFLSANRFRALIKNNALGKKITVSFGTPVLSSKKIAISLYDENTERYLAAYIRPPSIVTSPADIERAVFVFAPNVSKIFVNDVVKKLGLKNNTLRVKAGSQEEFASRILKELRKKYVL